MPASSMGASLRGRPTSRWSTSKARDRSLLRSAAAHRGAAARALHPGWQRAVQAAHRALVVHRDLKPSNIVVTDEGEPRLLDFGIAKLLDPEGRGAMTRTVRVLTPEYASPEQVLGASVTTASDVYQLGLLLYELLTATRAADRGCARRTRACRPPAGRARTSLLADCGDAGGTGGGGAADNTRRARSQAPRRSGHVVLRRCARSRSAATRRWRISSRTWSD